MNAGWKAVCRVEDIPMHELVRRFVQEQLLPLEPAVLARDMQGKGVGRLLVHEAMDRAQAAGCYKLALSSNERREAAHAFYDSLGFQRHGFSFVVPLGGTR
mgnify:CR=1 FL=1